MDGKDITELFKAAKEDRLSFVKEIADFIRHHEVTQGDQYGTWQQVSPDAEQLAQAIEEKYST